MITKIRCNVNHTKRGSEITIPAILRKKADIRAGDTLEWIRNENRYTRYGLLGWTIKIHRAPDTRNDNPTGKAYRVSGNPSRTIRSSMSDFDKILEGPGGSGGYSQPVDGLQAIIVSYDDIADTILVTGLKIDAKSSGLSRDYIESLPRTKPEPDT